MAAGYLKFTGDYSKLNDMGYSFQKLYAANYMQWEKDGLRIWKKGGDVTHDEYDLYKMIKFFRTQPEVKSHTWKDGEITHAFYKFYNENGKDYEFLPYTKENQKIYGETLTAWSKVTEATPRAELPLPHTTISVSGKLFEQLQELKDLGWYELVEHPKD